MEDYETYVYVVLRMLRYDQQESEIISEQISLDVRAKLDSFVSGNRRRCI